MANDDMLGRARPASGIRSTDPGRFGQPGFVRQTPGGADASDVRSRTHPGRASPRHSPVCSILNHCRRISRYSQRVSSRTPLATPVVPAPKPPEHARAQREDRAPLIAPLSVVTPVGEFELPQGALLIGRLPDCSVCLDDPLVSRMHARIIVQGDCVVVEDLHSANGVYLNGVRVASTAILREGDRLLMGTTEVSLFELRTSSLMKVRVALPIDPRRVPRPPALPQRTVRVGVPLKVQERKTATSVAPPVSDKLPVSISGVPTTARASALQMIGVLADRLASEGDLEEAIYVVSGQLRRILQGTNSGLSILPEVAALASRYALKVAHWSRQALWVDYVVELHLSAHLLMSAATLEEFGVGTVNLLSYDRLLLAYYVEAMRSRDAEFSAEELARVELLACFAQRP
jgi:FHA domain